jgi:iron complex outermembrane recepter protein
MPCNSSTLASLRVARAALAVSLLIAGPLVFAQSVPSTTTARSPSAAARDDAAGRRVTEQLVVSGERVYPVVDSIAPSTEDAVDTAELLKQLPGANINANGPITGIAQYRGLYGDRVAISVDGVPMVTGGPNAMDAPLSYASPLLLEHVRLERGIASVSSAIESLGGHFGVDYDRGRHADGSGFEPSGKVQARYVDNGNLGSVAARIIGANETHKVALLTQRDRADDLDYPGGKLLPTRLERDRYDLSYAYRGDAQRLLVYGGRLETNDTGTPSLPMDIVWIGTDLFGVRFDADLGSAAIEVAVGYTDVEHEMNNFSMRTPPATPAQFRSTYAAGNGYHFRVGSRMLAGGAQWRFGVDGRTAEHSAVITNPNAPAFEIVNFAAAERDLLGAYGQWNRALRRLDVEAGVRVNRARTGSGDVGATIPVMNPMSEMMAASAALLAADFNASDTRRTHTNVDAVVKIGRVLGDMRSVYVELGRKTRVPSYQELFLWLPLESTGGLADGRSYLGNPALDSEVSREINIGSNWHFGNAWLSPQAFYKDIAGYIQGVPSQNAAANAVATMMSGQPALEFANTDARIFGADLAWGYYLTEALTIDGVVTWVRGERTDVDDRLYRIAPPNARVGLTYDADGWSAGIESVLYASQRKVSAYNGERPTPGYGILNANAQWRLRPGLLLHARASNLLDKRYQDHLDGINRVAAVDVPVGERLYGLGRSLQIGVQVDW